MSKQGTVVLTIGNFLMNNVPSKILKSKEINEYSDVLVGASQKEVPNYKTGNSTVLFGTPCRIVS